MRYRQPRELKCTCGILVSRLYRPPNWIVGRLRVYGHLEAGYVGRLASGSARSARNQVDAVKLDPCKRVYKKD